MYQRILVANRGEIALRIIRACRELGVETVAIFSEGDRGSRYLELADETYCVGPAKAADSYLKIASVISAAEVGNVQAIHPGYGFLAENAHFNEICRSCNIDFIGPSPAAMAKLGDKNAARSLARATGVPVVPGSQGIITTEQEAMNFAHDVGFPVLIKAVAGGGGRGMRVASNDLSLKSALQQARAEAEAAFGNGDVYLEKYVEHPRHVEVQVLADLHGNVVHLWERDCSVQRRHQKLIEESPSTSITPETRNAMCDAARRLIQAAEYTNAATVEFIVDKNGDYYFIEVNARIQVEHPVTEMVTGIDLIKWQIRVAAIVIFLLGFAAGALALNGYKRWNRGGGDSRQHRFERMLDSLELNAEQKAQVHQILGDTRQQLQSLRKESEPRVIELRRQTDERLQKVLTPDQWTKFQQQRDKMRERGRGGRENRSGNR